MKNVKRVLAILLAVAMTVSMMAGCGSKNEPAPAEPSQSIVEQATQNNPVVAPEAPPADAEAKLADSIEVVLDNNPITNLDPTVPASMSPGTYWALIMTHESLVTAAGNGVYEPCLATEWTTEDYQTFNFKLRDDVYFDNGEKLTAEDVVFTCERSLNAPGSPAYGQWSAVDTITAVGDYEVQIVLKEINVNFLFNMSNIMSCIVNKKAVEADIEKGPWVGTGTFVVEDFLAGDHVTMVRSDSFRGEAAPTRQITLRYVPETSTRTIMMQNEECQLSFGIGNDDASLFQEDPNFVVIPQLANNPQGMQFNLDDPIVGDINFRKAFIHGIDREEISIIARGDWAEAPTEGTIWGYETEFRNTDIPVLEYDPELAKEYLAKSSYSGETIELAVGNPTNLLAAETIMRQLEQIGIKCEVKNMDTASLNAYNAWGDNKSMVSAASFGFNMSSTSVNNLYMPGGANNRSQYNNPEVTALLEQAMFEGDVTARGDLYKQVQALVAEDLPGVQLFWLVLTVVATDNLGGWVIPSDTYSVDLRGLYLVEE